MNIVRTERDAERLFRDYRIYKALQDDRMISHVAQDYGVSEKTARTAYNRVKLLDLTGRLDDAMTEAKRLLLPCFTYEAYIPQACRTSSGARFTPL